MAVLALRAAPTSARSCAMPMHAPLAALNHFGGRAAQGAAINARSRMKTGLPAKEGDDDLVDWYYIAMNPNTATGKEMKKEKKHEWPDVKKRLAERYGEWVINWC